MVQIFFNQGLFRKMTIPSAITPLSVHPSSKTDRTDLISRLRKLSLNALRRMYLPEQRLFVFTMRRGAHGVSPEGVSRRYTAITLIGLAEEPEGSARSVLAGHSSREVCERLASDVISADDLGNVALTLWAACAVGLEDRRKILARMIELDPAGRIHPTVEVAWALKALCEDKEVAVGDLRKVIADRLLGQFKPSIGVFPHILGTMNGFRAHVSCFADMVYPIQALSAYYRWSGSKPALEAAAVCARRICELQGPAGQWWWHYDIRTGQVLEGFPVYSVHQDAMAPMALFELKDAGGPDYTESVWKGLDWILRAPEVNRPLLDENAGLIWRKVTHREPRKLCRYLQAAASRLHPSLRVPGLNILFPPVAVDYECRPYHLGWLLHAFSR